MITRKLQQTPTGTLILTIPSDLAKLKGWKKQDVIGFDVDSKGDIVLRK